jgi:hypothetical protein
LVLLAAGPASVVVRSHDGVVDVRATSASVADVLDALSRETGMKVIYDGARPAERVSLEIRAAPSVEVVLRLFEGLGLNYALSADKRGISVGTLIVGPAGPLGRDTVASSPSRPAPRPPVVQRFPDEPPVNPEAESLAAAAGAPAPDDPPPPPPPRDASAPAPTPAPAPATGPQRIEPLQAPKPPTPTPSPSSPS